MFGIVLKSENGNDYLTVLCLLIGLSAVSLFKPIHYNAYKHAMVNAEMIISHPFNYNNSWMENDGEKCSTASYTSADKDFFNHSTNSYIVIA